MQIRYEAWLLLLSLMVGCWLMLVYDLLRVLRLMIKHSSLVRGVEDFLFWIYAGAATLCCCMSKMTGACVWYVIAGVLFGMLLYDKIVSRFFVCSLEKRPVNGLE